VPQEAAQALVNVDSRSRGGRRSWGTGSDDPVAQSLVGPFEVIVLDELANRPVERSLTEQDHAVQALLLDRAYESFGEGVAVRSSVGREHGDNPAVLQCPTELLSELAVAVADQQPVGEEESVHSVGQVSGDLRHERFAGSGGGASDVNSSTLEVDQEQGVVGNEALWGPHFGGEEVRRSHFAPVRLEKRTPRRGAIGCGLDALALQDPRDRGPTDAMTKVLEGTLDARIFPGRVLLGHVSAVSPHNADAAAQQVPRNARLAVQPSPKMPIED